LKVERKTGGDGREGRRVFLTKRDKLKSQTAKKKDRGEETEEDSRRDSLLTLAE